MPQALIWRHLPPLVSGIVFGAGLTVGGMVNPERVRRFLDLFGPWDPTLMFVMGGAVAVMALAWAIRRQIARPVFANAFDLPERTDIDGRLIGGSILFGIGWGLAGICPGPAIASIALAPIAMLPFIAAMIGGMAVHHFFLAKTKG